MNRRVLVLASALLPVNHALRRQLLADGDLVVEVPTLPVEVERTAWPTQTIEIEACPFDLGPPEVSMRLTAGPDLTRAATIAAWKQRHSRPPCPPRGGRSGSARLPGYHSR